MIRELTMYTLTGQAKYLHYPASIEAMLLHLRRVIPQKETG